ncbi:MAG: hypothetical protein ABGY96_03995 [bacterium]|nr:hypothetical protein [Gammaproteobacteria bacterium]HIL98825.1 hypothetical protein [Pseudomonadales bacterium]
MSDSIQSEKGVVEDLAARGTVWRSRIARLVTWLITFGCFYLIYTRVEKAAYREDLTAVEYMVNFFAEADWILWLCLMIPYSIYFFLIDSHATWRLIRWFNAPEIKFTNILPIRASAYILSLVNEQVGKGAMSLYLLQRYEVPVWKAVSSMIMLGLVEIYQLLIFSAVGVLLYYDLVVEASTTYPLPTIMLSVYAVAFLYFPFHLLYFRGHILRGFHLRDRQLLHAFRQAELKHYVLLLLFKAPNMLGAMLVYTLALSLFKVDVGFGQMFAFLPVIFLAAALPLPFHAGALVLWTVLFPEFPEVGVFSMVMHTFFVVFNAVIGLVFLPKANKELFIEKT